MPRMSEAELREWYERFSKEVWLKAQIDVTSKEDLGRVRNAEIKNWEADDLIYAQVDFTFAYMPRARTVTGILPRIRRILRNIPSG